MSNARRYGLRAIFQQSLVKHAQSDLSFSKITHFLLTEISTDES